MRNAVLKSCTCRDPEGCPASITCLPRAKLCHKGVSIDDAAHLASLHQAHGWHVALQGYNWRNVLASFVHVHFGSCPALAAQLVERCAAVDVAAVCGAAMNAAEANAGPRSFPLDSSSLGCNGGVVHRQRDYRSATVSPEGGAGLPGVPRPIFPVSALLMVLGCTKS